MKHLHFLEIENFKRFGAKRRIELDHPSVLIGPNNCGKTTAIQAIALWSQAVQAWSEKKGEAPPAERKATSLNRLAIPAVPVPRTRYFWTKCVGAARQRSDPPEHHRRHPPRERDPAGHDAVSQSGRGSRLLRTGCRDSRRPGTHRRGGAHPGGAALPHVGARYRGASAPAGSDRRPARTGPDRPGPAKPLPDRLPRRSGLVEAHPGTHGAALPGENSPPHERRPAAASSCSTSRKVPRLRSTSRSPGGASSRCC